MSGFEEQYEVLSIVQQFQLREGWADKALAMEARPRKRQSGGPTHLAGLKKEPAACTNRNNQDFAQILTSPHLPLEVGQT